MKKNNSPKTSSSRRQKVQENFALMILQHLHGKNYRPTLTQDLALRLAILPELFTAFEECLTSLKSKDLLYQTLKGEWLSRHADEKQFHEGIISFHPRGFAFVRLDKGPEGDVFIPPSHTLNALPSDHVLVEITGQDRKGPEGRVVQVIKRSENGLFGVIIDSVKDRATAFVPAFSQHRINIELSDNEILETGERVMLKVLKWEQKEQEISCALIEKLGHINDPSLDTDIAIDEYGLRRDFPGAVLDEALAKGKKVSIKQIKERLDLRETLTLTIDPDTAKDFDDAISIIKKESGFSLGVHIADVAHYVQANSSLDEEASKRSNSTYFPGYCLPMLPAELSNELCSLKPNVNRLTVSVLMEFNHEGALIKHEIVRSVIKSRKRLSYRQALAIIKGETKSPFFETLNWMVELCHLLKKQKAIRGSVEFSLPDASVICNQEGKPIRIDYVEYDITHQMIEEFMVKANEVVASHLDSKNKSLIFRVHEAPLIDDLKEFLQSAKNFGHQFSGQPTPQHLQQFFVAIQQAPYASQLATSYIRSMKLAQYSPENVGHYGLGLSHYCHFTSPIRRYSDLTVIRALFNEQQVDVEQLTKIAQNCSDAERQSAKAESSVSSLKKLRLLKEQIEENPQLAFEVILTKIRPFGISFDLQQFMFEGFIHISALGDDYFIFDEEALTLRGKSSQLLLQTGIKAKVKLLEVDLIHRECKWQLHLDFVKANSTLTTNNGSSKKYHRSSNKSKGSYANKSHSKPPLSLGHATSPRPKKSKRRAPRSS
jgi:ribonuclease R